MSESLKSINDQGDQLMNTQRNATVVGDAAQLTERIDRAGKFTGALKNFLSTPSGKMSQTEQYKQELNQRRFIADEEYRLFNIKNSANEQLEQDIVDVTSRTISHNLMIATLMNNELENQNEQLDRTNIAVSRASDGMLKITKAIK